MENRIGKLFNFINLPFRGWGLVLLTALAFFVSCGSKNPSSLADKKAQLETLKKQQTELSDNITKLEKEIVALDPSAAQAENAKLVTVAAVVSEKFEHYIDLQGKIDAVDIGYVTPRNGQGGQVKELFVKQGDYVNKGKLLLKLDDAIYKKQLAQLQTQLGFAKDLYQRQQNLWKENIGTEVQLITAKNNVDNINSQINTLKEQISFCNVYASNGGVIETLNLRVGEFFTGVIGTSPQISIVNTSNLKLTVQVPENYINRVKVGTPVKIFFPDLNKTFNTVVNVSGKLIDPLSRGFYVEAKLPNDKDLKPNQVAQARLLDYAVNNAIAAPVNTLQTDEKGKFIMVAETEKGKLIARKKPVTIGELYGDKIEIKSGLQIGDKVIVEGFQSLYEGQTITTTAN